MFSIRILFVVLLGTLIDPSWVAAQALDIVPFWKIQGFGAAKDQDPDFTTFTPLIYHETGCKTFPFVTYEGKVSGGITDGDPKLKLDCQDGWEQAYVRAKYSASKVRNVRLFMYTYFRPVVRGTPVPTQGLPGQFMSVALFIDNTPAKPIAAMAYTQNGAWTRGYVPRSKIINFNLTESGLSPESIHVYGTKSPVTSWDSFSPAAQVAANAYPEGFDLLHDCHINNSHFENMAAGATHVVGL